MKFFENITFENLKECNDIMINIWIKQTKKLFRMIFLNMNFKWSCCFKLCFIIIVWFFHKEWYYKSLDEFFNYYLSSIINGDKR
jgi:hypothetical protein